MVSALYDIEDGDGPFEGELLLHDVTSGCPRKPEPPITRYVSVLNAQLDIYPRDLDVDSPTQTAK